MSRPSSESSLQIYLNQIQSTPLLNAARERELARRIQDDNDFDARDLMIRSNLRLVVAIAKKYANRGLPIQDLIEEGNIGLVKAVESFNPDMGARFSTYGSWWIKQAIKRALINAVQPVHVPAYMVELITKWKRAASQLEDQLGRPATLQEMAQKLELPLKKARAVRNAAMAFQRPAQTQLENDGQTASVVEMLPDPAAVSPEDAMLTRDQIQTVRRLLERIDPREAMILRLRYGLDDTAPLTLKDIGEKIGLTRERVRQLEIEALRKMQGWLSGKPLPSPRRRSTRRALPPALVGGAAAV